MRCYNNNIEGDAIGGHYEFLLQQELNNPEIILQLLPPSQVVITFDILNFIRNYHHQYTTFNFHVDIYHYHHNKIKISFNYTAHENPITEFFPVTKFFEEGYHDPQILATIEY